MRASDVEKRPRGSRWRSRKVQVALVAALSTALLVPMGGFATPAHAIVGGETVRGTDYPWMVAFVRHNDGTPVEERFYCSGVLIKPLWVLTAAHCPFQSSDTVVIGRSKLHVTAGEKRSIARFPVDNSLWVLRLWNNSTYCSSGDRDFCDLALVRLSSASTHPDIDLADANEASEWGEGTAARVYGYGLTDDSDSLSGGTLKRAHLHITSLRKNHYTLFAKDTTNPVTDTHCKGDSGGPLIVSTSNDYRLVGIARAAVGHDPDPELCTPGLERSYVKVGYRNGPSKNRPAFRWISASI